MDSIETDLACHKPVRLVNSLLEGMVLFAFSTTDSRILNIDLRVE